MKTLNVFAIFAGAAMLTAAPVSLQWSQEGLSLSLDRADARIGRPATPLSVAGAYRRADRRAYRRAVYGGLAGAGAYGLGSYYYGGYGYPASYAYSGYRYPGYASYASYGFPGYNYASTWGYGSPGYGYASYGYPRYGWAGYRGAMASAPAYYAPRASGAYGGVGTMGNYSTMQPSGNFQAVWTQPTTATPTAPARTR